MPGRNLPTFAPTDVISRRTAKSCFVSIGTQVYDITPFLDDHPGGADLILDYGGKDVKEIMGDELSHNHSEAAYEILEEHLVGFIPRDILMKAAPKSSEPHTPLYPPRNEAGLQDPQANGKLVYESTGMSSAEDLSIVTDRNSDYKTHKFLDLNKPLLMQVWNGGFSRDFYLEQVHRPRHYRGGESAPLFGNFLEPLSKTPWWVIPTVWLPPVAYGTYLSYSGLSSALLTASYWLLGLGLWTIVEYGLHRGLFHMDQ
ncbi:MAG: fatty acid alpha-hydroxylase [Vezdaea aestivalis]|nr:MAG: fatty acid alpha-hydroxylase [Vezdaea aestivalis]